MSNTEIAKALLEALRQRGVWLATYDYDGYMLDADALEDMLAAVDAVLGA